MPKFPHFSERVKRVPGSVFEKFRPKMKEQGLRLVRLHIGDTYLLPKYPLPIREEFIRKYRYFNRYCHTFGVDRLRRVLVKKVEEDNGFAVKEDNIMLTNGATNGLSASTMSILNPGDEMLVLTPCWPFFPGMIKVADARVVEVPFYVRLFEEPDLDISAFLKTYLSEKTAAVYLNTPNNPSGKVLTAEQLRQIADFCRRHRLWIISDEAYDGLTFDNHRHISIGTLPGMLEQTITVFTFSKSFMFAGLRLGFIVAEEEVVRMVNKTMVHQLYSPSTLGQYMMVEPVIHRKEWIPAIREHYRELRDLFIGNLNLPVNKPEGTYFIFMSIEKYLRGADYWQMIDRMFDAGVSVAPGGDFGKDFEHYIRICFTGEPPERLEKAAQRLRQVLEPGA